LRTAGDLRSDDVKVRLFAASMAAAEIFVDGAPSDTIEGFIEDLDHQTFFSRGHSISVAKHVAAIHRAYGASSAEVVRRYQGGLLHDIGKVGVAAWILGKPGPLTDDEFEIVKTHAPMGSEVVSAVPHLEDLAGEVRHHHERVDGTGYPDGLVGDEIPFAARVLAVADSYDAMTSPRVYRDARSCNGAVAELLRSSGTQLDGEIVAAFLGTLSVSA